MISPLIPQNESERVAAACALNLLDSAREDRFDRITRLAQHLFDVPFAMISLIDGQRQWFKSAQGDLSFGELPRENSFCSHAILSDETLVVGDAENDERFQGNPLVAGEPGIRFFAGRPLSSPDGNKVGVLCIVDRKKRTMSAAELALLDDLGKLAEDELGCVVLNKALAQLRRQAVELDDFFENANDLIQSVAPDGKFIHVNRAWRDLLGYTRQEIAGLSMFEVIHPDNREHCAEVMRRVLSGQKAGEVEVTLVAKSGRNILVSGFVNCYFERGQPAYIRGIFRDITERRKMILELRESEERFRQIAENIQEVFWIMDSKTRAVLYVSKAYERIWGRSCQDLYLDPQAWIEGIHFEDRERVRKELSDALDSNTGFSLEYRVQDPSGNLRHLHNRGFTVPDASGRPYRLVGMVTDISERKRAEEEIRRLASTDALTGLFNSRHFGERLAAEVSRARRHGSPLCLAMLDLDNLKLVNDSHGHQTGSRALALVGKAIRTRVRASDTAARIGGDEFCVLLTQTAMPAAIQFLEELRQRIAALVLITDAGKEVRVTCSIGVVMLEDSVADASAFLNLADRAMYDAKRAGRNQLNIGRAGTVTVPQGAE